MRFSQSFIQTLREPPGEARLVGHQLMLRAGLIRSAAPGSFGYLPLGVAAQQRVKALIVSSLVRLGGQEVRLPTVQPRELWNDAPGNRALPRTARFRDSGQHELILSPDLAPVLLAALAGTVQSYRHLPLLLYQEWHGFFDTGHGTEGVFGARESYLLDSYLLHAGSEGSAARVAAMHAAIMDALQTLHLPHLNAQAERGEKLVYALPGGNETILHCPACGYEADQEVAATGRKAPAPETAALMEEVATPDCKTIAELAAFLNISADRTAKAIFLVASFDGAPDRFIFAILRGDTNLNEAKLRGALGARDVGPATEAEIRLAGAEPGYGSPIGIRGATVVVDELAANSPNLVAGANRHGYHALNVNCGRDYQATQITDLILAEAGDPCPRCGAPMQIVEGIELARTIRIGPAYSDSVGATFLDPDGQARPVHLGQCRIWLDRLLAAVVQSHHDDHGIVWPDAAAPYRVHLMTVGKASSEVTAAAEGIYAELGHAGIAVLYDDRDERAGVKFHDADLLGMPLRIAMGERGLKNGTVELKRRGHGEVEHVPLAEIVDLTSRPLAA